jgi:DNA-binding response OmpR family regulator
MHGYASQGGMGIGLYTAYKMALAHKGSLTYNRSETLGGSMFTLSIPIDKKLYGADEYKSASSINKSNSDKSNSLRGYNTEQIIREMLPNSLNEQHIVIIEDDPDMLEQIKAEVGVYFHVSGYTDGQSGINSVKKNNPALLICDVMLPDTNGYEIVRELKSDVELKDIPVIMLTALEDEKHQIKGYEVGADDYMVKPCNYRVLIARAIQLIKWKGERKEWKEEETPHATIITSLADKRFKEKVNTIITQHISDEDFNIDQMAEIMHMGRTKLYGKVKELTGMSPNKLLSAERMRIAAELLEEGELNISEIGFRVGISDASYFNKCFKQHFGMTPSKYKKEK